MSANFTYRVRRRGPDNEPYYAVSMWITGADRIWPGLPRFKSEDEANAAADEWIAETEWLMRAIISGLKHAVPDLAMVNVSSDKGLRCLTFRSGGTVVMVNAKTINDDTLYSARLEGFTFPGWDYDDEPYGTPYFARLGALTEHIHGVYAQRGKWPFAIEAHPTVNSFLMQSACMRGATRDVSILKSIDLLCAGQIRACLQDVMTVAIERKDRELLGFLREYAVTAAKKD